MGELRLVSSHSLRSHAHGPRGVFGQVHALAKNGSQFFRRCGGEILRGSGCARSRDEPVFFRKPFLAKKTYLMSVAAAEGAAGVLLPVHAVERKELTL